MAVRNLHRQARPFRVLGWSLFAVALVLLPASYLTISQLALGLLLATLGATALEWLPRSDVPVKRLQLFELLSVPGLLLAFGFPLPLQMAVNGALVNANVALGGRRALVRALGAIVVSLTIAAIGGARIDYPASADQVWLVGTLLLLIFTVALADIGFRLTQKLDDHRRQAQDRVAVLQPFVPQGLNQRPPEQERRWITVVMIDLVEFTARSSPLPPEVVGTVLDDLLDAVVSRANQSGGTLDKFMGDGALLFFGGQPDRAAAVRDAVRFVRQLLTDLNGLNARWQGYGVPERLQLRAGIASGYCSLGQWGTSNVRAYTMVGACVGLAERLQSVSQADALALCPVSARLLFADQHGSEDTRLCLPESFKVIVDGSTIALFAAELDLKGFARMRVYRPSAKVLAP